MKILTGVIFMALMAVALSGCGASTSSAGSGPSTPANLPVAVEGLDGKVDVPVGSSFQAEFSAEIDSGTVTEETFFIVAGVPASTAYDTELCNSENRLAAPITADSGTEYTVDPSSDLQNGAYYTICLSPEISVAGAGILSFLINTAYAAIETGSGSMYTFLMEIAGSVGSVLYVNGEQAAGTEVEDPDKEFVLGFGSEMNPTTVISGTEIVCDSVTTGTTFEAKTKYDGTESKHVFGGNITESWRYGNTECRVQGSGIQDSAGNGVAVEILATIPCLVSGDDFTKDPSACWTPKESNDFTTWPALYANIFEHDEVNSQLVWTATGDQTNDIYKDVSFTAGEDITIEMDLNDISGITAFYNYVQLSLVGPLNTEMYVEVEWVAGFNQPYCAAVYMQDADDNGVYETWRPVFSDDPCTAGNNYSIKMQAAAGTDNIRAWYKSGSGEYVDLDAFGTLPDPDDAIFADALEGQWRLVIYTASTAAGPSAGIDYITTTGLQ